MSNSPLVIHMYMTQVWLPINALRFRHYLLLTSSAQQLKHPSQLRKVFLVESVLVRVIFHFQLVGSPTLGLSKSQTLSQCPFIPMTTT